MTETDPFRGESADHLGVDDASDEASDEDLRSLFTSERTATQDSETLRESLRRNLFGEVSESTKIGRYVIRRHIGSGGMGAVYLAYDSKLRRSVALKLLHRGTGSPGSLERRRRRLLREAHGLARLSHPNVVQVHDVDTHGEHLFLVMDYVEGCTLKEWLEVPRSWREILEVFRQAGEGLAAAHSAGLIHRDIKPSNVLISSQGQAKVIDFGLVRVDDLSSSSEGPHEVTEEGELGEFSNSFPSFQSSRSSRSSRSFRSPAVSCAAENSGLVQGSESGDEDDLTIPGAVLGTLAYIPPEIFSGASADARSDVYSFCVSLYEALYGSRPFAGETRDLVICQIIEGRRQPPPSGRAIPRWLTETCLRGLAVDPAKRPASMVELLAELSPRRELKRRLLPAVAGIVGIIGAAVAAIAVAAAISPAPSQGCGAESEIPVFWSMSDRAAVRGASAGLGLRRPLEDFAALDHFFSQRSAEFQELQPAICNAAQSPEAAASQRCLATVARDHHKLVKRIVGGQLEILSQVIEEPGLLQDPSICADPKFVAAQVHGVAATGDKTAAAAMDGADVVEVIAALEEEIEWAYELFNDGRYREALGTAKMVQEAAEVVRNVGLEARAWHLRGRVESILADPQSAESLAMAQMLAAEVGGERSMMISILDRARALVGPRGTPEEAELWARRVEKKFAKRGLGPLDRAKLHLVLGEIAIAKAEFAEARRHLEACLDLRQRYLGEQHPQIAEALSNLAVVVDLQGQSRAAIKLYRQALALREANLRPEHPQIAVILVGLGGVLARVGEVSESEAVYARALEIDRKAFGDEHPRVATILHNLGISARQRGQLDRAYKLYTESLAIRRKSLGPLHPEVADSLNALAILDKLRGDGESALSRYHEALMIRERQLGSGHPRVASTLGSLANLHIRRGEFAEAIPHLQRAQGIYMAQGPGGSVDLVWILRLSATAQLGLGHAQTALPLLDRAQSLASSNLAKDPSLAAELVKLDLLRAEARAWGEPGTSGS